MRIKNINTYGIEESCIVAGLEYGIGSTESVYQMSQQQIQDNIKAAKILLSQEDLDMTDFLSGIVVQFDVKFPQYISFKQFGFTDIISSQSTHLTIHKANDFKKYCNEYVLPDTYNQMDRLIHLYNTASYPVTVWKGQIDFINTEIVAKDRVELFHYLLSNVPMGYEMWMRVSTNYKKLREIYNKKVSHKTRDWKIFIDFIRSLPHSYLITKS